MTANEGSDPSQKAPGRRKSLLNRHRMKQFQRLAVPLKALEKRLVIWARTPGVSTRWTVWRPEAEGAKHTRHPETRNSETPANWALRRIPAQSPIPFRNTVPHGEPLATPRLHVISGRQFEFSTPG